MLSDKNPYECRLRAYLAKRTVSCSFAGEILSEKNHYECRLPANLAKRTVSCSFTDEMLSEKHRFQCHFGPKPGENIGVMEVRR